MGCDILSMEWDSSGRDIHITEPVLSYLEMKHGLNIVRESIWDGAYKLLKYKPKILLLSNTVGAHENFNMARIASKMGITVVSLISEGDFVCEGHEVHFFFWGWNYEKKFYEDLRLLWSDRTLNLIRDNITDQQFNLFVSGATGFDRYKILPLSSKNALLQKYHKEKYQKLICFAGYGFDRFSSDFMDQIQANKRLKDTVSATTLGQQKLIQESGKQLNKILGQLIESNPDILFILKYHPGLITSSDTEFAGLDQYENTLSIWREDDIANLISASDLLLAFDSTTCLEAWLLGKETALINPCGTEFERSRVAFGSPIYSTYEETNEAIRQFYAGKGLAGFNDLQAKRSTLINEIIGYSDGLNHVRAGEKVIEILKIQKAKKIDSTLIGLIAKEFLKGIVFNSPLRFLKKVSYDFYKTKKEKYKKEQREKIRKDYSDALRVFYQLKGTSV